MSSSCSSIPLSANALMRGTMIMSHLMAEAPAEDEANDGHGHGHDGGREEKHRARATAADAAAASAASAAASASPAATALAFAGRALRGGYLITPGAAAWLYALLARLPTPLLAETASVVRQLFLLCCRVRAWLRERLSVATALGGGDDAAAAALASVGGRGVQTDAESGAGPGAVPCAAACTVADHGLDSAAVALHAAIAPLSTLVAITGSYFKQRLPGEGGP